LFKVIYRHFGDFQEDYHRLYSERYGFFRPIIAHTVERFLACGDPREGIARYECPNCRQGLAVPFSCKTRLFCPSCHEKRTLLWIESIQEDVLLPVSHRFWSFSVPKRLRPYFMWDRKRLGLLVTAANNTLAKSLSGGRLVKGMRPGIISLMQTHSGTIDWNCHLHLVVTDGLVDYTDPSLPKFKQCTFWNIGVMTEMFRLELLSLMAKCKALSPDVADNLMSWEHSGFHVYATEPFGPSDKQTLINRLAYAYRLSAPLNRLSYNPSTSSGHGNGTVTVEARKQTLTLKPVDFIAKLTLHIPNRYQNVRRYAGFYSSNIQRKVRLAKPKDASQPALEIRSPVKPKWATLIAKVFGEIPIACPKCGTAMDLKEFIFDVLWITRVIPELSRAPPKLVFDHNVKTDGFAYGQPEAVTTAGDADFNQTLPENDGLFNQDIS
jgi:hypothetical protein